MTEDPIVGRLRAIVHGRLRLEGDLGPETDLLADLQLDSVQQLELIVEVENEFRCCLEPDDERGLRTVSDLVALIHEKLG